MAYVIAVSNEKGGTGKSTTAVNVAAALAERGHKTLLVDLDPSFGLTRMLGATPDSFETTLLDVLREDDPLTIQAATHQLKDHPNLFLVPGHTKLAVLEARLRDVSWERTLARALADVKDVYSFIMIDCPPGLGFFPANAYVAADLILIPIQTEFIALTSLSKMIDFYVGFPEEYRPSEHMLLPTLYDKRTKHAQEVMEQLRKDFPQGLSAYVIPRTIGFSQSSVEGKPFIHYAPNHDAAKAYRGVAEEIISVWQTKTENPSAQA